MTGLISLWSAVQIRPLLPDLLYRVAPILSADEIGAKLHISGRCVPNWFYEGNPFGSDESFVEMMVVGYDHGLLNTGELIGGNVYIQAVPMGNPPMACASPHSVLVMVVPWHSHVIGLTQTLVNQVVS